MRIPVRSLATAVFLSAILVIAPSAGLAGAQQSLPVWRPPAPFPQPPSRNPTDPSADPSADPENAKDPVRMQQAAALVRAQAAERRRKMVEESARLLQLATELQTVVDKGDQSPASLDAQRKMDEIERLAHDVKQRMKG